MTFLRFIALIAVFGGWIFAPSSGFAQSNFKQEFNSVSILQGPIRTNNQPQAELQQELHFNESLSTNSVTLNEILPDSLSATHLDVQTDLNQVTPLQPIQTFSFADLAQIKSIRSNEYLQSPEVQALILKLTEAHTPRDPNRIYRKRFFWGIAFSGTQAKMKMQLDPVFWERNDSLINIRPQGQLGGGFGGSVAMRIMRQWELKMLTMLQLHNRNIDFDWKYTPTQTLKIETISLDIPLTLKYRSDMPNNTGFFVLGGVRWSHDFQSMEGTVIGASKPLVAIKEDTYYYEFGCGFEFRMEYVDMSIELKMSNGLNNALVRVPESYYSGSMSAIFPRLFSITLMAQN